ncbi:MAG TPA: mercury resistance system transport protein MerF [Reyranella sp.]
MRDRALVTTGAIGAVLAAICCTTPLLAVVFGAIGLTGWLTRADYVVMPALLIFLGLVPRHRGFDRLNVRYSRPAGAPEQREPRCFAPRLVGDG